MVIIPALNEEASIARVVEEVRAAVPGMPVLVIDDYSTDQTAETARAAGALVIQLPVHLGLGGCVQTGYMYAFEAGAQYVIRVDADGQHNPRDIPRLLDALEESGCEMVIGSRFLDSHSRQSTLFRNWAIVAFRALLKPILGKPIHDPTSGYVGVNRRALQVFSRAFPLSYPEIELLVVLQRKRFRFMEVPSEMRPRLGGRSTITGWKPLFYVIHVLLGVFVNVLRFDGPRPSSREQR